MPWYLSALAETVVIGWLVSLSFSFLFLSERSLVKRNRTPENCSFYFASDKFIKYFLPREKGPGFNSTPDMIRSVCVMFDKTNRYDNMIKDSIALIVVNLFLKGNLLLL